jgi:hypothetical protein
MANSAPELRPNGLPSSADSRSRFRRCQSGSRELVDRPRIRREVPRGRYRADREGQERYEGRLVAG